MPVRNPDGRFRNSHAPIEAGSSTQRTHWIELETAQLKGLGMSYARIAQHIMNVSRGQEPPVVALPPDVKFPPNFSISPQAICKRHQVFLDRQPILEPGYERLIANQRVEQMLLSLQKDLTAGDPKSIREARKLVELQAKLSGYFNLPRSDSSAQTSENKEQSLLRAIQSLSIEEQQVVYALLEKALGTNRKN